MVLSGIHSLGVHHTKRALCPVEKHSEIVPIDSKLGAYLILVSLLQKNCPQQASVPLIELIQYMPDKSTSLVRDRHTQGIGPRLDKPLGGPVLQCFDAA